MSDILPYLGVSRSYSASDAAGTLYVMEDLTGKTADEAEKILASQYLKATVIGSGDTVTGQIPAAGTRIAGNSQVLLYMGEDVPTDLISVPDFAGMNRQQASDAAAKLGLYILVKGNDSLSASVTVTSQNIPAGTKVVPGTTIELYFTDKTAAN